MMYDSWYEKRFFKPVEPQKEIKTYSVMEIFEEKEGTEFEIEGLDYIYFVLNGIARRTIDRITAETLYLNKAILNGKFIKIKPVKEVITSDAMKALEEGKTIESVYSKYRYKKANGNILIETDVTRQEKRGFVNFTYFEVKEIENNWIIL